MNPGVMRDRVKLLQPSLEGTGWNKATFSEVCEVWARVAPLRGGERNEAQAQVTRTTYRVIIRHRDDITEAWRIGWKGTRLKIVSTTNPDEHENYLELLCDKDQAE